ncbi:MAG: transposase, partial [Microcoleaceae cyanobacterium]
LWSPSYFAISCGGAPIDAIEHYIREQSTPKGAGSDPNSER